MDSPNRRVRRSGLNPGIPSAKKPLFESSVMPIFSLLRPGQLKRTASKRTDYINPAHDPAPNPFAWVYKHPKWKVLREAVIREVGYICQDKEHDARTTITVLDLDHIKEVSDGGAKFDRANVMLRCRSCHVRKTKAVAKARREREWWLARAAEGGGE